MYIMADENEEKPKVSKTEEKESFIKQLDERIAQLKEVEERIKAVTERNEELAARNLLGGKSDAGLQSAVPVETNKEYADRMLRNG